MNILLHACCGPCSCYPTKELTAEGHTFTMYYFNPNIHPYKEFKRRSIRFANFVRPVIIPS